MKTEQMKNSFDRNGFIKNLCAVDVTMVKPDGTPRTLLVSEGNLEGTGCTLGSNGWLGHINNFFELRAPTDSMRALADKLEGKYVKLPLDNKKLRIKTCYVVPFEALAAYRWQMRPEVELYVPAGPVYRDGVLLGYQYLIPGWLFYNLAK